MVAGFTSCHAAGLCAHACTCNASDISANALHGQDLDRARRAIKGGVSLMPATTDRHCRIADNEAEPGGLRQAKLRPSPSVRRHRAGSPSRNAEGNCDINRRPVLDSWLIPQDRRR